MDFDEIFRKCSKWDKEQVIRFWERSGSLSGSSGSRFFKGTYSQIILEWILMIVKELSSLDGGLRSPSALVLFIFMLYIMLYIIGYIVTCGWKLKILYCKLLDQDWSRLIKILYCKLLTNSTHLPAFPYEVWPGFDQTLRTSQP